MNEEERLNKNKRISLTKKNTAERHAMMDVRTFDVKIQENKCSAVQLEALKVIFLEQKWYKNHILNWLRAEEGRRLTMFDTGIKEITKKDKDMNDVPVLIKILPAQSRQCLVSRMIANMKTISSLRKNGLQKGGKLGFSKEETIIDYKQYGLSHKIISSKRIKLAGIPKTVPANGLEQFIGLPGVEFANARLIRRGTGYYVQFVCYLPKEKEKEKINQTLGIDFGCQTAFTLSTGEKIDVKVPESGRLKKCQKKLAKKQKGSENWKRELAKVRKEHQRIANRKADKANKLAAKFCQYRTVVIQDEQIKSWHKGGHGKAVQHSVLGMVKAKLLLKDNVVVLSKSAPTTKLCAKCGAWHDELSRRDRTFICGCGESGDRDVHAARNMVWFYENNVGVGRTKFKRAEMESLVRKAIALQNQTLSMKHEASAL